MKTILVTGGAGYVGSHCCKAFAQAGWRVVVYDNLSRGWRDMVKWGDLIEGDILDATSLERALREVAPDMVAHFAALAYVAESVENPAIYYRTNTLGSYTLLEAMRATGVRRLIFSSTCATYGIPDRVPIDEDQPQRPINPYGWSKLFVERMLKDYADAYGFFFAGLRYFNAAGADLDGEIGERHEPEPHLIPLAIQGVMDPAYKLVVNGGDFETRDGTAVRDYIHVTDLADAHARAAAYLMEGGGSMFLNIGTGTGTTVKEVGDAIENVSGRSLSRRTGPRRQGDPAILVAGRGQAERVLGWRPQHSSIEEIIRTAWRWHEGAAALPRDERQANISDHALAMKSTVIVEK